MAKIGFEAPVHLEEILSLINRGGTWKLSLISADGVVLGHYHTEHGMSQMVGQTEIVIVNGDPDDLGVPLFVGTSDEAAVTFLYGCFFGVFGGKKLEDIQDGLLRRDNRYSERI